MTRSICASSVPRPTLRRKLARACSGLRPIALSTCEGEIEPGDWLRVRTRRGAVELKARVDGAIPEGVVFIPFCYAEAAANTLTNPALDPFGKIPEFKYCAARLEAAGEAAD